MMRKAKRELERDVDRIEQLYDPNHAPTVVLPSDDEIDNYLNGEGPPEEIVIGNGSGKLGVAVPHCWPTTFQNKLAVTFADVVDAWRELTPAEREHERSERRKRGAPIPSTLKENHR